MGVSVAGEQAARWRERMVGKGNENTPNLPGNNLRVCLQTQSTLLLGGGTAKKAEETQKRKEEFSSWKNSSLH